MAWNAVGANIGFLDRAETQKVTGSKEYGFALFHPSGGHVQPLSMTRGFARAAIKFGAQLYENSPVKSMAPTGQNWRVTTPSGSVSAKRVILTTNAYSDGLWPKLTQTYLPMVSISLATAPLSDKLQKSILPNAVTLADTRRAIYYCRYDRDRRLIFGCVGSTDDPAALGGINRLKRGLETVFPQLADTPIEATWGGPHRRNARDDAPSARTGRRCSCGAWFQRSRYCHDVRHGANIGQKGARRGG